MTKEKECTMCGIPKVFSEFSPNKANKDGLSSWCKECNNQEKKAYHHTKKGLISTIFNTQQRSSKHRNHPQPTYTLIELREWAFSQKIFHELYDNWKASEFKKDLVPSFDRLDDYKGYSLDRLRIVTFRENYMRYCQDAINGINNKRATAIIAIKNGVETEFYSQYQAARKLGLHVSSINRVLKGKLNHTGGYKLSYKATFS